MFKDYADKGIIGYVMRKIMMANKVKAETWDEAYGKLELMAEDIVEMVGVNKEYGLKNKKSTFKGKEVK